MRMDYPIETISAPKVYENHRQSPSLSEQRPACGIGFTHWLLDTVFTSLKLEIHSGHQSKFIQ